MKYQAIKSFVGKFNMAQDEIKEITDEVIIKDLLNAGYIKPIEEKKEVEIKKEVKAEGVEKKSTPSKTKTKVKKSK